MTAISITDAALKYGVPRSTLGNWVRAGVVHVEQPAQGPGYPTMIRETDVARLAPHYRPGAGRGKMQRLRETAFAE